MNGSKNEVAKRSSKVVKALEYLGIFAGGMMVCFGLYRDNSALVIMSAILAVALCCKVENDLKREKEQISSDK